MRAAARRPEVMMAPSETLLLSWIFHLRDDVDGLGGGLPGRHCKAGLIRKYKRLLSGTMIEFSGNPLPKFPLIDSQLEQYDDDDEETKAPTFDPEKIFPLLWEALWETDLTYEKKVHLWSRLLVQFATIGRSADVTGKYCPKYASASFPPNAEAWTGDNLPSYVQVAWTNWKKRPKKQKNAPYLVRIYHNPKDLRFCPVHWLFTSWSLRQDEDRHAPGAALLPSIESNTYMVHLRILCDKAGQDCEILSSHSVRRSAAQWAGRCGADLVTVRNIGRWMSLLNLARYVSDGVQLHRQMESDYEGEDPIFEFWPFNYRTAVSSMESNSTELLAMQQGR
jgi:hypothetical protein